MLLDVILAESSMTQLIVVNNDSGEENERWLRENMPMGVIIETRPNDGGSFGAYNHAFQKYRREFNWWMFTEDDIVIGGPRYYDRFVDRFDSVKWCGMVAAVGVYEGDRNPTHAHGGVGLTHRTVLEAVCAANDGDLPYPKAMTGWNRPDAVSGEIAFTNAMAKLGFKLIPFGNNRSWNWRENACLPYLNWIEAGRPR